MIRTFLAGLSLALAVLLVLPWFVLWSLITGKPDAMFAIAMRVVRFETRFLGIRVRVEGLEHVPACACVFVANHASNIDPMVMIPALPRRVGILVKQELFRIPIFGRAMRVADFVPVDRGDRESRSSAVSAAAESLKRGTSYVVFAEGTRSPDGRMRPFKRGAVTMAIEAGVPIVPVTLIGTHQLLPKGKSIVAPGDATVHFGPPVDASAYTMEQRSELVARVESIVASALPPDQLPLNL